MLQIGLAQSRSVASILIVGPFETCFTVLADDFSLYVWTLAVVLSEAELVLPGRRIIIGTQGYPNANIRVASRGKRTQCRYAATSSDGIFEPTTNRDKVMKEADCVEEVRLPRGVRANQKGAPREIDIDARKVPPVAKSEMRNANPVNLTVSPRILRCHARSLAEPAQAQMRG